MLYQTVIRCSGSEFVGSDKNAFKSCLEAKKGLKLSKKFHVSMALVLDGTEIFRSHGMGLASAFWSFKQNLKRMKGNDKFSAVERIVHDISVVLAK